MDEARRKIGNKIMYCNNIYEAAEGADVFLMERHGAATVGRDLEQAFYRLETLETVAKMYRDSLIFAATSSQQKNNPAAKAQPLSWYLKQ